MFFQIVVYSYFHNTLRDCFRKEFFFKILQEKDQLKSWSNSERIFHLKKERILYVLCILASAKLLILPAGIATFDANASKLNRLNFFELLTLRFCAVTVVASYATISSCSLHISPPRTKNFFTNQILLLVLHSNYYRRSIF